MTILKNWQFDPAPSVAISGAPYYHGRRLQRRKRGYASGNALIIMFESTKNI